MSHTGVMSNVGKWEFQSTGPMNRNIWPEKNCRPKNKNTCTVLCVIYCTPLSLLFCWKKMRIYLKSSSPFMAPTHSFYCSCEISVESKMREMQVFCSTCHNHQNIIKVILVKWQFTKCFCACTCTIWINYEFRNVMQLSLLSSE